MKISLTKKEIAEYTNEIIAYNVMSDFEEELHGERRYTIDEYMIQDSVTYLLNAAEKKEPQISDDLRSCMVAGCHFEGLDNRIKSVKRLREKLLYDTYKKYGGDFIQATNHLYDTLRYTIILPFENHFEYLNNFINDLLDMDYELIRIKNRWGEDYCKGVSVILKSSDGTPFEIQFHTQENYDIKEIYSREPYKLYRNLSAPNKLRDRANQLRVFYHSQVRLPEGALTYQFVRKSKVK